MLDRIKHFIQNIGNEDQGRQELDQNIYLESESNGFLPYNTASVKIKAFKDYAKTQRLNNISVQWYRQYEKRNYLIDNIEDSYNFSCDDLGSKIIVVVTDNDRVEICNMLSFGPIILDSQCRTELEQIFKSGKALFEIQLPYKHLGNDLLLKPPEYKDPNRFIIDEIAITPDNLTFIHSKGVNDTYPLNNFKFESVPGYPLLIMVRIADNYNKNLEAFELRKHFENGNWFYVKFFNRIFRETFLMITRLFSEVKSQTYSNQLAIWESRGSGKGFFSTSSSGILGTNASGIGDVLLQVDRIRESLNRNVVFTKTIIEERDSLVEYSNVLERDLKTTLKDLKELVIKQKLQDQVDFSRIEKIEGSIMEVDRKKQLEENRFDADSSFNNIRLKQLQEENQKLEKSNKVLLKEVNAYRQKRKEKIKSINQSLNALNRELAVQADNLNAASNLNNLSLDFSNYLENINNESFQKSNNKRNKDLIIANNENFNQENKVQILEYDIREQKYSSNMIKNQDEELLKLTTENTELKQTLAAFEEKMIEIENKEKDQNSPLMIFFVNHFQELRKRIENLSSEEKVDEVPDQLNTETVSSDDRFYFTLQKMVKDNRTELLNLENSSLSTCIQYLINLTQQGESNEIQENMVLATFAHLQQQVESLKSENDRFFKELLNIQKDINEKEELLRNEISYNSAEIYRLTAENEQQKNELQKLHACEEMVDQLKNEMNEKEKLLQRSLETNRSLAEEIQRLQEIINSKDESTHFSSIKE